MQPSFTTIAPPGATSNATAVLAQLAATAGRHYRQSAASWLEAATVILEARAIAEHGGWAVFLRDADIPARTASRMLDFARAGIQNSHLAVLTRSQISALIGEAHRIFPGPPPEWEYARAMVEAVIEIAAERGFDAGELARFVAEFPNRRVPRAR